MTIITVEVGELVDAVMREQIENIKEELADVSFGIVSIANVYDIKSVLKALSSMKVKLFFQSVS